MKRQMRVISAHGRITGWILAGLPPVLGFGLMSSIRSIEERCSAIRSVFRCWSARS